MVVVVLLDKLLAAETQGKRRTHREIWGLLDLVMQLQAKSSMSWHGTGSLGTARISCSCHRKTTIHHGRYSITRGKARHRYRLVGAHGRVETHGVYLTLGLGKKSERS
jgi:hypothetical protein